MLQFARSLLHALAAALNARMRLGVNQQRRYRRQAAREIRRVNDVARVSGISARQAAAK